MKINILKSLLLGASVVALASCSENSWNDKLDGFEDGGEPQDVQTISYTLTDADYATIASLSDNKALAGDANAKALKAVGTQHYFTQEIPAADYVPAFLSSSSFPYFTLSDNSAIKLTYNVAAAAPAELTSINAASQYTVSTADYQTVWGSEEDYAECFAPSHTAAKSLPGILKNAYPNAANGDYAIVTYKTSDTDPVFENGSDPTFSESNILGTVKKGDTNVAVSGVIMAQSTNGFILADKGGSIFVYFKSGFAPDDFPIGSQVKADATISSYNTGLQIDAAKSTFTVVGKQKLKYPTPTIFTATVLEGQLGRKDALAMYGQMTGTVAINGNNINILMGSDKIQGGVYYVTKDLKAKLKDGENVTVTGYFIAIAGKRYCNFVATDITPATKGVQPATVANIASETAYAVYQYNGSSWKVADNTVVVQNADYTAMGQKYTNLTDPDYYLPIWLKTTYPYAKADDALFVVYRYYANQTTTWQCDQYTFNGSEWILNNGVTQETSQFVKRNGKWFFDPSVTINLVRSGDTSISKLYYQTCVDWVYENIDRPLGSTSITSGVGYVTKYGNNEYYSGTSAYQNDVDLRAESAKAQYPAGYEGMTNDQIVELMKKRFSEEVLPAALAKINPDATPVPGLQVIYTINFVAYDGANHDCTAKYEVTGKGQFKLIECTWF